jgi:hypothetical protein
MIGAAVFIDNNKRYIAAMVLERPVATAAPATPISNVKMKTGSSTTLRMPQAIMLTLAFLASPIAPTRAPEEAAAPWVFRRSPRPAQISTAYFRKSRCRPSL